MVPKQDPKPKFQEGERVLCFHGPLLSEAKCVKDKQVKYFIRYSGWMGARKQGAQIRGHQFAETVRTLKGQSGTICRRKDERGCSREEDIWSATEKCWSENNNNNNNNSNKQQQQKQQQRTSRKHLETELIKHEKHCVCGDLSCQNCVCITRERMVF
jgi:hypothetical protein